MLVARVQTRGAKLSDTWPNYPMDGTNLGKLRLMSDTAPTLERGEPKTLRRHRMWLRPIR
jgi:hypothetical protein